jgi:hypothetical protein
MIDAMAAAAAGCPAAAPAAGVWPVAARRGRLARRARRVRRSRRLPAAVLMAMAPWVLSACGGTVRSPTEPAAPPAPVSQALTFTQIQSQIFTSTCAKSGCHSGAAAAEGMVLSPGIAYASIVKVRSQEQPQFLRVNPGNPEASYLLHKVRGDADITGSRMPQDGPPFLTPQQIAGIEAWIQAGAPNN